MVNLKNKGIGSSKPFLLILGIMLLAAILITIMLYFPFQVGTSKGPWFWRQG
ncbi:MAG: hypothetical protein SCK28_10180 [Bacillota bacterium]|nr:hypothetical protein [Bacillota bacterium]